MRSDVFVHRVTVPMEELDAAKEYTLHVRKVIERKAEANSEFRIDFESAKSDVKLELGDNARNVGIIKQYLSSLMRNEIFDLDSIVVSATASPEGSWTLNKTLMLHCPLKELCCLVLPNKILLRILPAPIKDLD